MVLLIRIDSFLAILSNQINELEQFEITLSKRMNPEVDDFDL